MATKKEEAKEEERERMKKGGKVGKNLKEMRGKKKK